MKKVWGAIKFIGRLFFKPRTTFKGYKVIFICLLELILVIDVVMILCGVHFAIFKHLPSGITHLMSHFPPFASLRIFLEYLSLKFTLPLIAVMLIMPIASIIFLAGSPRIKTITRKKSLLYSGIILPLLVWFVILLTATEAVLATANRFASPGSIAIDNEENIYITGLISRYIFKVNPSGKLLSKFEHKGSMPYKVTIDNKGIIYTIGFDEKKILKFKTNGEFIEEIPINIKEEMLIRDLEVNDRGNIYLLISQEERERPRKYRSRMLVFNAQGKFLFDILIDEGREKVSCWDFSMDREGNIYLGDLRSYQILVFTSRGQLIKTLGTKDPKDSHYFGAPWSIDVDNEGNIYIARPFNPRRKKDTDYITKLNPEGKILMTIKGEKVKNWIKNLSPTDIEVDGKGNIYVVDELWNKQIYKFGKDGKQLPSIKDRNIWARISVKMQQEMLKKSASRKSGKTCPTCK